MSNQKSNGLTLPQAKDLVRTGLFNGTAKGVIGVGIDPIQQKLLVFVDQAQEAKQFLKKLGDGFADISPFAAGK